jgi:hypothetical protein
LFSLRVPRTLSPVQGLEGQQKKSGRFLTGPSRFFSCPNFFWQTLLTFRLPMEYKMCHGVHLWSSCQGKQYIPMRPWIDSPCCPKKSSFVPSQKYRVYESDPRAQTLTLKTNRRTRILCAFFVRKLVLRILKNAIKKIY